MHGTCAHRPTLATHSLVIVTVISGVVDTPWHELSTVKREKIRRKIQSCTNRDSGPATESNPGGRFTENRWASKQASLPFPSCLCLFFFIVSWLLASAPCLSFFSPGTEAGIFTIFFGFVFGLVPAIGTPVECRLLLPYWVATLIVGDGRCIVAVVRLLPFSMSCTYVFSQSGPN